MPRLSATTAAFTVMSKPVSEKEALIRLETLCARSEHCESELADKLRRWGIDTGSAVQIIESLRKRRFVDNRRFAISYVRDKYRFAHWGVRKITLGLRAKHISREIIDGTIDEIDREEYTESLRHIMRHKASTMTDADTFDGRTRLFRFAAARGFEPDLISKILREL